MVQSKRNRTIGKESKKKQATDVEDTDMLTTNGASVSTESELGSEDKLSAKDRDVQDVETTQDAQDIQNADDKKDTQDTQDAQDVETLADEKDTTNEDDTSDVPSTEELLVAAQAEVADWKDKYVRLHAEWDTYRRRTNEQRAEEKVHATEKLMGDLLPVIDDFERTIKYVTDNSSPQETASIVDGVVAVQTKLLDVLQKHGLEIINPLGQPFDALEAQAVAMVDDKSVPDETVSDVYQKGYKMGRKVLRSAMVTVTQGGPRRIAEEDETCEAKEDGAREVEEGMTCEEKEETSKTATENTVAEVDNNSDKK